MKYKAFVFDFDLTLADSTSAIIICFKHTLKQHGYEIPTDEAIVKTIGLTLLEAFDILTGVPNNPNRDEMKITYVKKADIEMAKNTHFYDGAIEMLMNLRERGFKTAICSTKYRYRILESFDKLRFELPLDLIVGGEDVSNAKPDPEGLELAIKRLGVTKSETLYIGDSYIDALTAQTASVDFGGVLTGTTTKEDFSKYKNQYISQNVVELFKTLGL